MSTMLEYNNPFPGLRAFEEQEDIFFFGREKQIDELLRKLRTTRFLAVIGSSGSGKSSLVKSGLIPSLHSGFMAGVSSSWNICSFRPGNDPIGNLAKALSRDNILYDIAPNEENTYAAITESTLRRSTAGLVEAYRQSGADTGSNVLILVDQFEELFRFSRYEKEAKQGKRDSVAFINLLLKATEQKELPLYVVFTMRSDFLGDCTAFRGLPEKINEGQYLVPRMTREERKEAIAGPIAVGGAEITPRLLNLLLNDVGDNPDQLPILQHAMMRTWNVWKENTTEIRPLDINDYEEAGTMQHALSQHAEEAYNELTTPERKKACEIMFKALTDREADARGVRRPRSVDELTALTHVSTAEQIEIIEIFRKKARGFLMPPEEVKLEGSSIIDIAHESLMRVWIRLINWVEEEGQSAKIYLRLCEAADQYELGKGGLWRDPELQMALKWKEENNPDATWALRYNNKFYKAMLFLEHSKGQYDQELRYKEEMQKQRLRRARRVVIVVGCIAVVAFLLAIYALSQNNKANAATKRANAASDSARNASKIANQEKEKADEASRKAKVASDSAGEASNRANDEKEKANEAKRMANLSEEDAKEQKRKADLSAAVATQQKATAEKNERHAEAAQKSAEEEKKRADKSADEAKKQTLLSDKLKSRANARVLANHAIMLLNEKQYDNSKDTAIQAYKMNQETGGPLQNNDIYHALNKNWQYRHNHLSSEHNNPVRSISASPSGSYFYSVDEAGTLYEFKNDSGNLQKVAVLKNTGQARSMTLSPGGSNIAIINYNGSGSIISVSGTTLKEAEKFTFPGVGKEAAFLSEKEYIVLSNQGLGKYAVPANTTPNEFIPYPNISAFCIGKNNAIILASRNKIMIYNSWADLKMNPAQTYTFADPITATGISPSGRYMAAGTSSGKLWLKDTKDGSLQSLQVHISSINEIKFAEVDGRLQLATAGADHTIRLVDVQSVFSKEEENILMLQGHTNWVYSIAYSPNGQYLYSAGEDQKVFVWRTTMKGLFDSLTR